MGKSLGTNRLKVRADEGQLTLHFAKGQQRSWPLPDKSDHEGIRTMRKEALSFAEACEATIGQLNAVRKAIAGAGYRIKGLK